MVPIDELLRQVAHCDARIADLVAALLPQCCTPHMVAHAMVSAAFDIVDANTSASERVDAYAVIDGLMNVRFERNENASAQ